MDGGSSVDAFGAAAVSGDGTSTRRVQVLTAHADESSLTVRTAEAIASRARAAGATADVRNIQRRGFAPAFNDADLASYNGFRAAGAPDISADVLDEQQWLFSADEFVVVFPVYWWSMPGMMKGWFDRVVGLGRSGREHPKVRTIRAHIVAVTGGVRDTYERHGYLTAMQTQIQHGIFDYAGFPSTSWTWMWAVGDRQERIDAAVHSVATRWTGDV